LIARVLYSYGRLSHADLDYIYQSVLKPARIEYLCEQNAYWHEVGGYETWIGDGIIKNKIDLVANLNVLILLDELDEFIPETSSIRKMLAKGIEWMGTSKARAAIVTPWYPDPLELLFALERAVRFGVKGLEDHIANLRDHPWVNSALMCNGNSVLCGSDDGRFNWFCEGLDRLRSSQMTATTID
jgi:hypothetical protein